MSASRALLVPLLLLACASALAQTQVYRYTDTDGRIVYSDRPPPGSARDVQPKRLGANYITTSEMPLEAQQAMERFPVTLYTYDCGDVCQNAEALLNRRGVPFSTVNVTDGDNAAKLKALTGEERVPVLQIGDKTVLKGFLDSRWQQALDQAGYPKAPPSRLAQTPRAPAEHKAPPPANGSVAAPAKGSPAAPPQSGDYPK
jgi:glutaredoxin